MKKLIILGLLLVILGTTAYTTGFVIMVNKSEPPKPRLHPHTIATEESFEEKKYVVKSENGILVIYEENGKLYDVTNIRISELPKELQIAVINGYVAESVDKLYKLLETYST